MSSNKYVFISPIDKNIVEKVDRLLQKNKSGTHLIFGLEGIEIKTVLDNDTTFLETMFPKYSNETYSSFKEVTSQDITGEMCYYSILYSGFPNAPVNTFASWVDNPAFRNLEAKGNFVLVHKSYGKETNVPHRGTFKDILDKFGMTIQTNVNVDDDDDDDIDDKEEKEALLETLSVLRDCHPHKVTIHKPFLDEKNNELWSEHKKKYIKNNKLYCPKEVDILTHYKNNECDEYMAIPNNMSKTERDNLIYTKGISIVVTTKDEILWDTTFYEGSLTNYKPDFNLEFENGECSYANNYGKSNSDEKKCLTIFKNNLVFGRINFNENTYQSTDDNGWVVKKMFENGEVCTVSYDKNNKPSHSITCNRKKGKKEERISKEIYYFDKYIWKTTQQKGLFCGKFVCHLPVEDGTTGFDFGDLIFSAKWNNEMSANIFTEGVFTDPKNKQTIGGNEAVFKFKELIGKDNYLFLEGKCIFGDDGISNRQKEFTKSPKYKREREEANENQEKREEYEKQAKKMRVEADDKKLEKVLKEEKELKESRIKIAPVNKDTKDMTEAEAREYYISLKVSGNKLKMFMATWRKKNLPPTPSPTKSSKSTPSSSSKKRKP